jgi:tetratricopeptide (TPR) repeat protein
MVVMMRGWSPVAALVLACSTLLGARQSTLDLKALLDQYIKGDYDAAVSKAASVGDLGPLQLRFVQDVPAWIASDLAKADVRRAAAAAFLLEFAAARYESDGYRFLDLIEWMCIQIRAAGPPTEFERAWHAGSHALAGRSRSRTWMLGEYARLPHQKPFPNAVGSDPQHPPAQHLTHALERFPDDPGFRLTQVVVWSMGRDSEPIRNVRMRENGDDRPVRQRVTPQADAIIALEPLTKIADVAGEAWCRTGIMQFVTRDYSGALKSFEAAMPAATDTSMKYLSHFYAGRSLEALSRIDSAIDEYRAALQIIPDAESATVAMTSLQFARDDRDEAIDQINRVFNKRPGAPDPGRLVGYGSFIHWPELRAAMRAAVSAYPGGPK